MKKLKPVLKNALKEALVEKLLEERDLLAEVVSEVVEDFALAEAAREGRKTKLISRDAVFRALRGKA